MNGHCPSRSIPCKYSKKEIYADEQLSPNVQLLKGFNLRKNIDQVEGITSTRISLAPVLLVFPLEKYLRCLAINPDVLR